MKPRVLVLTTLSAVACSLDEPSLERFPCDAGRCADGFVCHPETDECVLPVEINPETIETGDACESAGSFVNCDPMATDCSGGCRTCGDALIWSACSTGCGELGRSTQCGSCNDDCTTLPNVELATCEPSAAGFRCVIARCADGFEDASVSEPGCECQPSNDGREVCDGVDNDCDGMVDDFVSEGSLDLSCSSRFPVAENVTRWSCSGDCTPAVCNAGFFDVDDDAANGCEYACTPSGDEVCDGLDNDCNGVVDDPSPEALSDACTSQFPAAIAVTEWSCSASACAISGCRPGYSDDDGQIATGCEAGCVISNGGVEICDDEDNDCNGVFDDEGAAGCTEFYLDRDGDGFGIDGESRCLCAPKDDYRAELPGDCDDDPEGCGEGCRPAASGDDLCDGDDLDCDGADGEDDPALGAACEGPDTDSCLDEVFAGCFDGELFCGAPCPPDGAGGCVDNGIVGCAFGNASCGPADSIMEQCNDAVDDDCDGLNNCADSDCLSNPGCVGFEDLDGDGFTNAPTGQQDCDDTIPTCSSDCISNADAGGESEPVPDCVELYCGSNPASSTSTCRRVSTQNELRAAMTAANATPGRDFILITQSFTITADIPNLTDPAGVEIRQVAGTTVTVDRNEPFLDDTGGGSRFEHLRIRYVRNVTRGLRFAGGNTHVRDVTLVNENNVGAEAVLISGDDGYYDGLIVEARASASVGVRVEGDRVHLERCHVYDASAGGGELDTAIEVHAASGVQIATCAIGVDGAGYGQRGVWVHGSDLCGTTPAERSTEVSVLDSWIVNGRDAADSDRGAIVVCDSDGTRVIGNLIAASAHDGIVLDGVGQAGDDATATLVAFNTLASLGDDGLELRGSPSYGLCLTQSVFDQNAGASVRSAFGVLDFATGPLCLPGAGAPYENLSTDTDVCAGDCAGCGCLPGGDASRVFSVVGNPEFTSTDLALPEAYCPDSSSTLLDAGRLPPNLVTDRNGVGFGLFNGAAPELGARENGNADCP